MSLPKPSRRANWLVAALFVAVVGVGAWVGTRAGDLAHRAPRGSGARVAVLGPLSTSGAAVLGTDAMLQDAVARELASLPSVTVIPPLEIRSKRLQMLSGGVDDATDLDAAKVLAAEILLVVRPAGDGADLLEGGAVVAHLDPALTQLPALLGVARGRVPGLAAGAARAPVTTSAEAYALFLDGERLAQLDGRFREAAAQYDKAVRSDEGFADAWAALAWSSFFTDDRTPQETARLREAIEQARVHAARASAQTTLVIDALTGWLAHDDAAPELRAALREPAIAGARILTVKLPEERNGHLLLGRAYRELFDGASEGLRHLEAGRRLTPDYFPITQQIVIAWLDIGDRRHAEQALRGFLTSSPAHPEATRLLEGLTRGVPVN